MPMEQALPKTLTVKSRWSCSLNVSTVTFWKLPKTTLLWKSHLLDLFSHSFMSFLMGSSLLTQSIGGQSFTVTVCFYPQVPLESHNPTSLANSHLLGSGLFTTTNSKPSPKLKCHLSCSHHSCPHHSCPPTLTFLLLAMVKSTTLCPTPLLVATVLRG